MIFNTNGQVKKKTLEYCMFIFYNQYCLSAKIIAKNMLYTVCKSCPILQV